MKKMIFVVCVDRDNDLGRKAKIRGPVVGKEANLNAAIKLALADPTESDANTIFAAIKKLEEAKKEYDHVEIVTITGYGKTGLKSDKEISAQLDKLQKKYFISGWIVVTDGMEDAQVFPLLQSRAKIVSTEEVIIKQAQAVESTFYTIKEALKDPGVARMAFGIPGLILVLVGGMIAFGQFSIQIISLVLGAYLLLKGFGIEEKIIGFFNEVSSSLSEQRGSVLLYMGAIFILLFWLWAIYWQFITSDYLETGLSVASAVRTTLPMLTLAMLLIGAGKAVDCMHLKKAYLLGKYFTWMISIVLLWSIVDAGTAVFLRQTNLDWFLTVIMISLVVLVVAMKLGAIFDIRGKITKLFIGTNVMDEDGNILGKVTLIDGKKQSITFVNAKKKEIEKPRKEFDLKQGKIILNA
ncbi:MAG: DUF373 family protein [Candidatus Diapherotrites archaeon]|nr:DUF373 family protein [Candidatus Diapherotrites archaeon]